MDGYVSQQKKQLLDSLENQVRFSQLVAVVIGEKGIGKSFLIEKLQQRLDLEVVFANIDASFSMTPDQLEKSISLQLGLSWQATHESLTERINESLEQKVFLTIDDAHNLSSECLEYVLGLNQQQLNLAEGRVFVLLAGEPSLASAINDTAIFSQHQEMCVVLPVEPILQNETQSIVLGSRLGQSFADFSLNDPSKLHYFWQLSKGNPAELFYHIERWIEEQSKQVDEEITEIPAGSIIKGSVYGVIGLTLILVLVYQDEVNQWISPDKTEATSVAVEPNNMQKNSQANALGDLPLNERSGIKAHQVSGKKSIAASKKVAKQPSETPNEKTNEDQQKKTSKLSDSTDRNVGSKTSEAKEPLVKEVAASTTKAKEPTLNAPTIKDKSNPKTNTETKSSQTTPKTSNSTKTADEVALLGRNGNLFALQWTGVSSFESALAFRRSHPLKDKMLIYPRKTKGKTLYMVVSGQFLTRDVAKAAQAEYKRRGYVGSPWAKPINKIQSEIRAFHQ